VREEATRGIEAVVHREIQQVADANVRIDEENNE